MTAGQQDLVSELVALATDHEAAVRASPNVEPVADSILALQAQQAVETSVKAGHRA